MSHRPLPSASSPVSTLVLLDFDGTITRRDSLFDFIKFYRGQGAFYVGMLQLLPTLVKFKAGFIPNWKAKEYVLTHFFANEPIATFQHRCDEYSQQRLPQIVKESALRKIREFQESGADIYLVSASAENWLCGWCKAIGIRLIATRLATQNGRINGKILNSNCYGPEKVERIRCEVDLERYPSIYAYGDSRGDQNMLALAHYPHYRFFK